MLAGVIGYFVSCALVGILAVGSVRTGLPTLVQSRFAFGYHGNKIPTFFGYVANMGWKVTMLSMASTTLADLMCHLVPVLAQPGRRQGSLRPGRPPRFRYIRSSTASGATSSS